MFIRGLTKAIVKVYELLGLKGIVMPDPKPIIDKSYIDGGLAFRYHNGGHTDAPEWPSFFEFAAKHFDIAKLGTSTSTVTLGAKKTARQHLR